MKVITIASRILGSILLMSWAIFVIALAVIPIVSGQTHPQARYDDITVPELSRRLEFIEGLKLESRITILETIQKDADTANIMTRINTGTSGLVLLGFGMQMYRNKKRKQGQLEERNYED